MIQIEGQVAALERGESLRPELVQTAGEGLADGGDVEVDGTGKVLRIIQLEVTDGNLLTMGPPDASKAAAKFG